MRKRKKEEFDNSFLLMTLLMFLPLMAQPKEEKQPIINVYIGGEE